MQPTFISLQPGERVECIKDCEEWCCHQNGLGPKKGFVGTIESFENTVTGEPGLHLTEVKVEPCSSFGYSFGPITIINIGGPAKSVSWPVVNFRPLIEDKEEKSDHVEALKKMARELDDPINQPFVKEPEKVG